MAEATATAYEEQRRRQIEANKRKMEELQLHHLSADLREATKPSPAKKRRKARVPLEDGVMVPPRRSGRVANLPDKPVYVYQYREAVRRVKMRVIGPSKKSSKKSKKSRKTYGSARKDLANRMYATDEQRSYAISEAEKLMEQQVSRFPIFIKPMKQSHVTGGFWLGLPVDFCRKHLPKCDEWLALVDENGDESRTLYLAMKRGLSAGWRGFAIDHKLVDGDCLVFQLIEKTKFKVYIIRASSYRSTMEVSED